MTEPTTLDPTEHLRISLRNNWHDVNLAVEDKQGKICHYCFPGGVTGIYPSTLANGLRKLAKLVENNWIEQGLARGKNP